MGNVIGRLQFCLRYLFVNTDATLQMIQTLKSIVVILKRSQEGFKLMLWCDRAPPPLWRSCLSWTTAHTYMSFSVAFHHYKKARGLTGTRMECIIQNTLHSRGKTCFARHPSSSPLEAPKLTEKWIVCSGMISLSQLLSLGLVQEYFHLKKF